MDFDSLLKALVGGTIRRAVVYLGGFSLLLLHNKLGLNLSPTDIQGVEVLTATYLFQSVWKAIAHIKFSQQVQTIAVQGEQQAKALEAAGS